MGEDSSSESGLSLACFGHGGRRFVYLPGRLEFLSCFGESTDGDDCDVDTVRSLCS